MSSENAKIGHPAPNFKATAVIPDGQFKDISLLDYKEKYVVFFFYPLDFTFVCPEIIAFSDRAEEFKKLNCQVIGSSVDSHFCHLAWLNTPKKQGGLGPMNIPLISDLKHTIAQDYGVLKADEGISFRGLFIIDDKGILQQITVNDLPVGLSVDETLRLFRPSSSLTNMGKCAQLAGNLAVIPLSLMSKRAKNISANRSEWAVYARLAVGSHENKSPFVFFSPP
ncbi:Peroxiredoxin-1 [Saguinus oedipus]|uniref:Peroxiredoxin-1 n=1 Tax=Saguinus oedipus TaxID=9490 RepID=A0ABQ9TAW3_SAGOE|nr:Peroxiredoxin-1 [Saguinus oedipus]